VAFAPYDVGMPWPELKDSYTDTILKKLGELFPGIRERFTFIEGATPLALEKYSRNTNGAMYGWENTPQQSHARRLPNSTPIEGLYLASAWAQPSSGTIGVMQSGFQTAQIILGYGDKNDFLHSLGFDAR
jgi:prolycopene isomerase